MAKKIGKALIFTAVVSTLAAGGIALYNKYKASTDDFDDDFLDFDDDDDDDDDDISSEREYVSIPRDEKAAEDDTDDDEIKVNVDVKIDGTFTDDEEDDAAEATDSTL